MIPSRLLVALALVALPKLGLLQRAEVRLKIGKVDASCTRALASFHDVLVVGSFASDRGCIDLGYVHPGGAERSLDHAAPVLLRVFHGKSPQAKKEAAIAWTREALFQNRALSVAPEGFGGPGQPAFAPASARLAADGRVVVTLWVQEPSGMLPVRRYTRYEVTFSAEGEVTGRRALASSTRRLR